MCILMNENPLIRYYIPSHHPPLGPLASPPEAAAAPAQPEGSSRWRSAMTTNIRSSSTTSENEEHISKRLAYLVQRELDEYRKSNHDFPVCLYFVETEFQLPIELILFVVESNTWGDESPSRSLVHHRSRDGSCSTSHARIYVPSHGYRPTPNRGWHSVQVRLLLSVLLFSSQTHYVRYKFENSRGIQEDKTATLGETDQIWTATRHMHLLAANEQLKRDFNKFLEDNAVFRGG